MSRVDLLVLTPDDLAAMTNRGTVKRAQKELEEGTPAYTFQQDGDNVVCEWSDGIVCRFPAGKSVHDAVCSSGVPGISRHIVRSVLAYQQWQSSENLSEDESVTVDAESTAVSDTTNDSLPAAKPIADWNPGDMTDEQLVGQFRQATIAKARQRFEHGVLVELVKGPKPLARFLDEPCTIRFLVPHDLRYVSADCSESLQGLFVPMAVWAFRRLGAEQRSGIVAVQQSNAAAPEALLTGIESLVTELCVDGLQGTSATWPQRLSRQEEQCRSEGLVWLAELMADLQQQREMYASRDALFDPLIVTRLAGELLVRTRAIRSGTTAVPQLLIRGTRSDRMTELAGGRLIGLGCGVRRSRRSVTITAFLQDADAGGVVGIDRTYADPADDSGEEPGMFADLSRAMISRGISLATIGAGQLLIKSARRTPGGRLILPRTSASVSLNPQGFAWEHLRSPLAVEGFAELSARLDLLPPSSLRPRRLTEALHVCPIEAIEEVAFDVRLQRLTGTAVDAAGDRAAITFPYTSRGQSGFESLSAAITDQTLRPRFISGHVSRRQSGITIEPICVVFETPDGKRRGVCPWTDEHAAASTSHHEAASPEESTPPLTQALDEVAFELSELLVNGLRRGGTACARRWQQLATQIGRSGLVRLGDRSKRLGQLLDQQSNQIQWDFESATQQVLDLLMLNRMADDIGRE